MKKLMITALVCATFVSVYAQDAKKEDTKYRRSSLYMMMLPDDDLEGDQLKVVENAFTTKAFPDKYNNHNLKKTVFSAQNVKAIDVTQDQIHAAEELLNSKKKGIGKIAGKLGGFMKKHEEKPDTAQKENTKNAGYIAKLNKYFDENHVAQKLFAKWLGGGETADEGKKPISYQLVEARGLQTLSQEEIATNRDLYLGEAMSDIIPRTFIMVNRYAYTSAEEIIAMTAAVADQFGAGGYASLGGALLSKVLKGYFVMTNTYLYQLDLTNEQVTNLVEKYKEDISGIYNDKSIKLKYVGKTMKYAPATMKLSTKSDADTKLIARATVRATDAAIADLQKKYEEFKTLATLHQEDDGTLFSYIGKKEGIDSGDKFEVLERVMKDGKETFKVVTTIKVDKKGVWDNREGAGEIIQDAAQDKEDDDINTSLTYTTFGKSKKMLEGSLIRQVK